jgi:ABC-type antimicrobial peptide transport system permease subunit
MVVRDALVIGLLGSGVAFVVSLLVMQLLNAIGLLTVYGINVPAVPTPGVVFVALTTGVGLTLCGAAIAVGRLLYRQPAPLLAGEPESGGEVRES